jgi:hypothetical protein
MSRPLYLDDLRSPTTERDWVICRSVEEAKRFCGQYGCPTYISFDHDLGDNVPTGMDFAKWLTECDLDNGGTFIPVDFTYNIHSANPVGEKNIRGLLDNYLGVRVR